MKILFIGEIVGKPGRAAVKKILPKLKKSLKPDFVLSNGENLSHNKGISVKTLDEMLDAGIDYFTSGNHIWDKKEFMPEIVKKSTPVLRPANYSSDTVGRGEAVVEKKGKKILLLNLEGRVFMDEAINSPFKIADKILKKYQHQNLITIVDFHAEATSEKLALAYYLSGRVSAVIGTHTHVPTADARILDKGTGFVSDVGMTGPYDSILGVKKEIIIEKFLTEKAVIHDVAGGDGIFNAILIEIDDKNHQTKKIQLLSEKVPL